MVVTKDNMNWKPLDELDENPKVLVGGDPKTVTIESWPVFNKEKLPFFARIEHRNKVLEVFLGSTDNESWLAENGANCVTVDGKIPEWIEPEEVNQTIQSFESKWGTNDSIPEPLWLQGDETPEGYEFVAQIPSQIDGGEEVNIGQGYGTAYIFYNTENNNARMVWQS